MSYFRTPIVVVLGATGAGKSKLALELAQKFKGEIISADAMQMYNGLNIVTNKVSREELDLVKHHMIDFLDPLSQVKVTEFRNMCLPILEDLVDREVIPFICGGTHYYIESLIWKNLVDTAETIVIKDDALFHGDDDLSVPTAQLYSLLQTRDPERAETLHKNERRKIYRSLQITYHHGGKKHSDFIREQRSSPGGSHVGGPLRFKNVCFLWVDTDLDVLDERCDRRVDKMIELGMLNELENFHKEHNAKRTEGADYTMGIFQSIGFKEFHDYLTLKEEEKLEPKGQKLYQEGIVALKHATHRYARRQIRWIKRRLLNPLNTSQLPVYRVDSTEPARWEESVFRPAVELVQSYINGEPPTLQSVPLVEAPPHDPNDLKKIFVCELCEKQLKGIVQYNIHLNSKKHKHRRKVMALNNSPVFTLIIEENQELANNENTQKFVTACKKICRGKISTSEIIECLNENRSMDLNIRITQSEAEKNAMVLGNLSFNSYIKKL